MVTKPVVKPVKADDDALGEYIVDGLNGPMTVQLTAAEAEARGAKSVHPPANKAVRPADK